MDVLLVEADAQVREILAEELLDAGFDVALAPSAEAAMGILNTAGEADAPPTILVTAMKLGEDGDGLVLAEEVQRCWPGVGVIVMADSPERLGKPDPRKVWLRMPLGPLRLTTAVNELMLFGCGSRRDRFDL